MCPRDGRAVVDVEVAVVGVVGEGEVVGEVVVGEGGEVVVVVVGEGEGGEEGVDGGDVDG